MFHGAFAVDREEERVWMKRKIRKEFSVKEGSLMHDYLGGKVIRTSNGYYWPMLHNVSAW